MTLTGPALAGVALIAVATLAGAWTAARAARMRGLALAAGSGVLAAVVVADLAPDIWRDLPESGLPWWAASAALAAGFAAAGVLARRGCACQAVRAQRGGPTGPLRHPGTAGPSAFGLRGAPAGPLGHAGAARPDEPGESAEQGWCAAGGATAAALAVHRALEGAAVGLTGSAPVIAALVLHAAAEGFALVALLRGERRGRTAALLAVACLSPAAGALALGEVRLPAQATPLVTALIAGILLRTALAAWQLRRSGRPAAVQPARLSGPAAAGHSVPGRTLPKGT